MADDVANSMQKWQVTGYFGRVSGRKLLAADGCKKF